MADHPVSDSCPKNLGDGAGGADDDTAGALLSETGQAALVVVTAAGLSVVQTGRYVGVGRSEGTSVPSLTSFCS
jgi:hypothetical protein